MIRSGISKVSKLLLFTAFLLPLLIASLVFLVCIPEAPGPEIKAAREKLSHARQAEADRYAPALFGEASSLYDSAMAAWNLENKRFILFRRYERVSQLARISVKKSVEARTFSIKNAHSVNHETAASLEALVEKTRYFEMLYVALPLPPYVRDSFNRVRMLQEEIRIARERHNYLHASQLLREANGIMDATEERARLLVESFFEGYPVWKQMADKALEESARSNTVVIIVDKLARKLFIYKEGQLKHAFPAEFGPNWLGDKQHQGDQATPEGIYQVVRKKEKRQTRYYKALLLNYPNADDRLRYNNSVASGTIPPSVDIGGLIEIHGHGGQGFNWTNGCVALSNHHMDVVYRMSSADTPVIITGSLIPMNEWIDGVLAGE